MNKPTLLQMKTITLLLLTALNGLAATVTIPISQEPVASAVSTNDDVLINATNAGTATWTTKRATVGKVASGMLPLILPAVSNLIPNMVTSSPAIQSYLTGFVASVSPPNTNSSIQRTGTVDIVSGINPFPALTNGGVVPPRSGVVSASTLAGSGEGVTNLAYWAMQDMLTQGRWMAVACMGGVTGEGNGGGSNWWTGAYLGYGDGSGTNWVWGNNTNWVYRDPDSYGVSGNGVQSESLL